MPNKSRETVLVVFLVAASLGAGILIDRKIFSHAKTGAVVNNETPSTGDKSPKLPPVTAQIKRTAESNPSASSKKVTAADAQAEIDGMLKKNQQKRYEAMRDFAKALDPSAIPAVMQMIEKIPSQQMRMQFRYAVLGRWGEVDPTAAMAFAEKTTGAQNKQQAVLAVLRGWIESDSDGAMA